jgi:monomeric isocitrate dehydrogenase
MYWAEALAAQDKDAKKQFYSYRTRVKTNEASINTELINAQGKHKKWWLLPT